jgi:hypothetical protein
MRADEYKLLFRILQIATLALFLGRAWEHIFWDPPFRALLWSQNLMEGPVKALLNMEWKAYVTSPIVDRNIQLLIRLNGIFYLICAILVLFASRLPKVVFRFFMVLGSLSLLFLAMLFWKEYFQKFGQFVEYSLQVCTPLFFYFFVTRKDITPPLLRAMKIATAVTFVAHGLYAIGYYVRPGNFLSMFMAVLNVSEDTAVLLLNLAGAFDFLAAVLIFIPGWPARLGLLYCVFWGFSTSAARIWAYFYPDFWQESLFQWTHEFLLRMPHFLIPLLIYLFLYGLQRSAIKASSNN